MCVGTVGYFGGCIYIRLDAGFPGRHFLRHSRWSSVSAKDGYVKDSLACRLSVSKAL